MIRYIIIRLLNVVEILIFIRCIISWLPLRHNRFTEFMYTITEPVLEPIRSLINRSMSRPLMFDLSPIVAFFLISIIRNFVSGIRF